MIENGWLMQRGSAMLFFLLVPWIVLSLCMASPLPAVFRALPRRGNVGAGSALAV
jgi:hypothetical protein